MKQTEPLRDNRIVISVPDIKVRKPFAPASRQWKNRKAYNRNDFKNYER